jgi:Putative abortive phage resistance protein AbiGi, antitoxin
MKPISSSTLFHFTDKLDKLLSILANGFYPRYNLESVDFDNPDQTKTAFPMVCFCDIPLSQAAAHLEVYGKYGIGLTKEWGSQNGITPVLYTYQGSRLLSNLSRVFIDLQDRTPRKSPEFFASLENVQNIYAHIKPYEGTFTHRGRKHRKVRFYDEREWRYVPDPIIEEFPSFVNETMFKMKPYLRSLESRLESERSLQFDPQDVKYLVVQKDSQIFTLANQINRHYKIYSKKERAILSTKIISTERILDDF